MTHYIYIDINICISDSVWKSYKNSSYFININIHDMNFFFH
jgi:hypothetical protein